VVCAASEDDTRLMNPDGDIYNMDNVLYNDWEYAMSWAKHPKDVKVELIGTAVEGMKPGVICASFHAG
jgi:hypothetical protein